MKKKRILTVLVVLVCILAVAAAALLYACSHTDIPKLYLEGDMSEMHDKSDERAISFRYADETQSITGYAKIKLQGSSSLAYAKKNYTLKFYSDESCDEKLAIDVGWGPQSKYCMKANWIDRTHARNVVTAKLAGQVQEKYGLLTQAPNNGAVDGFPVEIYQNGSFHGLYTFNIPKDAWQFGMDEDNPDHIVICGENWEDPCLFKAMPDFETWAVEVGEESEDTLNKMNRLFDFVMNSTDEEFREHFPEYLNLDSALNYYVMTDVAFLTDNRGKNMLLATYDGLEWYPSLYDLDSSWGANVRGDELYGYDDTLLNVAYGTLFARMETCFPEELAQRYFELRADVLSREHIMEEFNSFKEQIPALTFAKEYFKWEICAGYPLPGFDYTQIESYLDSTTERLNEKYQLMLNTD